MWNYNYFVYITTNRDKKVLYVGVTNDLLTRLSKHRNPSDEDAFTGKYHCYYLVYYERFSNIEHAIEREKQIKKWRREKKDALITSFNPEWRFLNNEISE